jgi:hypothetical protein
MAGGTSLARVAGRPHQQWAREASLTSMEDLDQRVQLDELSMVEQFHVCYHEEHIYCGSQTHMSTREPSKFRAAMPGNGG